MTREEIEKYALSLGGVHCDCPFKDDFTSLVLRHKQSGKWFGIYMSAPVKSLVKCAGEGGDRLAVMLDGRERACVLNLKCPPELSFALFQNFSGIVPAYHMNKRLWISVVLDADVDDGTIKNLITLSYDVVREKSDKSD